jgi:hypothetical protein
MILFDSFLKLSAGMAEVGRLAGESAMKTAQAAIETFGGIPRDPGIARP